MKNILTYLRLVFPKSQNLNREYEKIDIENVSLYYDLVKNKNKTDQELDEQIILDLDLHDVFYRIDKTTSAVGKQYLYRQLIEQNSNCDIIEKSIRALEKSPTIRKKIETLFSRIQDKHFYQFPQLFLEATVLNNSKKILYYILSLLACSTLIASFINIWFIFPFFLVLIVNFYFHYQNKRKLMFYTDTFLQLRKLYLTNKELSTFPIEFIDRQQIIRNITPLSKIQNRLKFLSSGNYIEMNDLLLLFWYPLELLKSGFLLEVIVMQKVLTSIEKNRTAIRNLYETIGEIDLYISILRLREELPYFCKPVFTKEYKTAIYEDVSHPLIENCVLNTLNLKNESLLITGSNMSGKTTFLRTIAINNILGKALNTCFARRFEMPYMQTYSSIRITDDLANSKSYFQEEVCLMKKIIDKATEEKFCLLVIDEMFKGTNTRERIACVQAILDFLNRGNHIVMFSTHDLEVIELLKNEFKICFFSEKIEKGQVVFDYKLQEGSDYTANAIKILELNDYPNDIIQNAYKNFR